MFIRLGVVHNIPSLNGPSHLIHKFLEALWKSQRQSVVQEFMSQLCNTNVPSGDLDELKTLLQEIKVVHVHIHVHTYAHAHMYTHTHVHMHTRTHTHTLSRTHTRTHILYTAGTCNLWYCLCLHTPQGFKADKLDKALEDTSMDNIITAHMIYSREVLMLKEGQQAFLSNGRVSFSYKFIVV